MSSRGSTISKHESSPVETISSYESYVDKHDQDHASCFQEPNTALPEWYLLTYVVIKLISITSVVGIYVYV